MKKSVYTKRKIVSLLLTLVMILSALPLGGISAFAGNEIYRSGDFNYILLDDYTAEIILYLGYDEVVDIPAEVDGYKVIRLGLGTLTSGKGDKGNLDRSVIKKVIIPESVVSLEDGELMFDECTGLECVEVDEKNTCYSSLDGVLFNKDKTELILFPVQNEMTSYSIPDSVTTIGVWAFEYCTNLTSVTIPDSVTSMGNGAFSNCRNLKSVTISNGVTNLSYALFSDCHSLENVTIPDSVTNIDKFAFSDCLALTSVTLGSNVTYLDYGVFNRCNSLSDIYIMNRNCHIIYENGFSHNYSTIPLNTTIHGYKGSTAEAYADKYGNEFVPFIVPDLNVTAAVDGEEYDGAYTSKEIVITAESDAEIFYSLDGAEWVKLTENSINAELGEHTYAFKAVDEKGFECDVITVVTKREIDVPVLSVEVTGTLGEWTKEDVSFKLSAEKVNSGATYYYSTDGNEWTKLDGDTLTVSESTNTKYVFKCINGVGIESELSEEFAVMIDKTVPVLKVEVTGTTGEWTKDSVSFKLSAENVPSGVTYYYSTDGNEWIRLDGDVLTVSENTNAIYVFKCVSKVGNESKISEQYIVMIDKTVPNGFVVKAKDENGNSINNGDKVDTSVIVELSAEDNTNTLTYQYSVNGGEWTDVDGNSVTFTEPDEYSVSFRAVSVSGVVSDEIVLTFTINKPAVDPDPVDPDPDPVDPEPDVLKGDVNGDGKITLIDAKWILQYIAGTRQFDDRQKKVADLNGDGRISTVDAKWVLQIVAGIRDAKTLELIK